MAAVLRLLGEVVLDSAGGQVDLGSPRQRCVLAALAIDAGRAVPLSQILGRVWGEDAGQPARATLHGYVSRLRRALATVEGIGITRRSGGYELTVDGGTAMVDLSVFRRLRDCARGAEDGRSGLLREALAWWSGEPLGGLSGTWVDTERDRLGYERLAVEHELVDLRLLSGDGAHLLAELSSRLAMNPLDEKVAAQYVRALHQSGRTAEALEEYRRTRDVLVTELGTEPGVALRAAHQHVLRTGASEPGTAAVVMPRQLPAAPAFFVGRAEEIALLDAVMAARGTRSLVVTVAGAGGMGKTWLALHWAHRHAAWFVDGQVFVDLNGFSPAERPLTPNVVLAGFLGALGVTAAQLPAEEHARSALFRSMVAGKRLLLFLDNAADTAQVLPLLPGGNSCLVLVTSRNALPGLVTGHGATHVLVDVLPEATAVDLLDARLGDRLTREDHAAVQELACYCGGYPLALAILAGRVQTEPGLAPAALAVELREHTADALRSGDPMASVSAALATSCRALSDAQLVAFQLLAIAPGPDIGPQAAAHLLGAAQAATDGMLRALAQASLVGRTSAGRYRIHDVIRQHVRQTARDAPGSVRAAALRRVIDYYLHTARSADALIFSSDVRIPLDAPSADCCPHPPPDVPAAFAWFDTEHDALLSAQQAAIAIGWDVAVWWIARVLAVFHQLRGNSTDQLAAWVAALAAGERLGDRAAQMHAHRNVGYTQARRGVHDEAVGHLRRAQELARAENDPAMAALTVRMLSMAYEQQDDLHAAATHAAQAVQLSRELGESVELGRALSGLGWSLALLGRYDDGDRYCREGWELFRRFPDPSSEARVLASFGYIAHHRGKHTEAIEQYNRALAMVRQFGYANGVAISLRELGAPLAALGRYAEAREAWQEAIELFRREGCCQEAADLAQRLDALPAVVSD